MKHSKEMEELIIEAIDSCYDNKGNFSSAGAKANVERFISQNFTPNSQCISKEEVEKLLDKHFHYIVRDNLYAFKKNQYEEHFLAEQIANDIKLLLSNSTN